MAVAAIEEAHSFSAQVRRLLDSHAYLRDTTVVTSPGELPEAVRRHIAREGVDPAHVRGVHADGTPYLVLSNIPDVKTAFSVALHEAVGHLGLRAVLGDDLERVMGKLYDTFPREHHAWQRTADLYGYLDTGTEAGRTAFGEELCAYMAELDEPISEWEMVQAEIRQAIRADFPDLPMNELDVRALVQRSRESLVLRHGLPEEIAEVRDRLQKRQRVTGLVQENRARLGKAVPDALSLALYRDGSRVVDGDGVPCRLYHGAGGEVDAVRRGFWGVVDPDLANEYAALRSSEGAPAQVIPYYADIKRPFDGDALKGVRSTPETPNGLTVSVFVEEVIRQAGLEGREAEDLRQLGLNIASHGRQEESGPTYDPQNFWYTSHWMFGIRGAEQLAEVFERAGFDGVRFTEQGALTYGAFSAAQLHFLDQGASLRGWQPDRHQGEGAVTERQPFKDWFSGSRIIEDDGAPKVMYTGTTGDISAFDERKIRSMDIDAECNGFWFSSTPSTTPAMKDPTNIMPVYLALQNPAPYPLVEKVSRQVRRDKKLRAKARSVHDEVRYRLQEQGYDGFLFNEPVRLSSEHREAYARTGQVALYDTRGREMVLRRGEVAIHDWEDVPYQSEGVAFLNKHGQRIVRDAERLNSGELLRDLAWEELVTLSDPDAVLDALEEVGRFLADKDATLALGDARLEHTRIDTTYPSLVQTGTVEVVDYFDENVGHVTSYESLDDFEAMHSELIAVAFQPEQIKSAIGNRGSFLRNHPDIRFRLAGHDSFGDWFAGSQVVDEAGAPRVVYHGTQGNFTEFSDDWIGEAYGTVDFGRGFYFTNLPDGASEYAEGEGGNVIPAYLDIKNPAGMDVLLRDDVQTAMDDDMGFVELSDVLADLGYDGIAIDREGGTEYVVFKSEQIRSAFAPDRPFSAPPNTPHDQLRARDPAQREAFRRWFGQSVAVDDQGEPLVVYRGEHSRLSPALEGRFGPSFQSRAGALSFSTAEIASLYASGPNHRGDAAINSRVTPAYLSMQKPVMNNPGDPFLEMQDVIAALGRPLAARLAREMADYVETTDHWHDNYGETYAGVADLLERSPEKLSDLYLQAYPVFDEPRYVEWFMANGFDGAIHAGSAVSSEVAEYKVFSPEQVKSVFNRGAYHPGEPDIRLSIAPAVGDSPLGDAAFQAWFGKSKVVEDGGRPRVVYHGTQADFTSFEKGDVGFHFAEELEGAANRIGHAPGRVIDAYLAIENPLRLDNDYGEFADLDNLRGMLGPNWDGIFTEAEVKAWRSLSDVTAGLVAKGYDGIVYPNDVEDGGDSWVAFRPDQIKSASINHGTYDKTNPDIRFSFAGVGARTADRMQLHHAKACLAAGIEEDLVRQETGWFRGVDGGWRFEIDDSEAELYPAFRSLRQGARTAKHIESLDYRKHDNGTLTVSLCPTDAATTTDFIKFEQVSPDVLRAVLPFHVMSAINKGEGVDEWGGLMPEAGLTVREPFQFHGFASLPLAHVLHHPHLFEAYPYLRHIPVSVDATRQAGASLVLLRSGKQYIELGRTGHLSSLEHEIQHIIQEVESFAKGGSVERMHAHAEREALAHYEAVQAEYTRVGRLIPEVLSAHAMLESTRMSLLSEVGLDPISRGNELPHLLSDAQRARLRQRQEAYYAAVEEAGGFDDDRVSDFIDMTSERREAMLKSKVSEFQAFDGYQRLAGEVEARNVQTRASMDAQQRRTSSPVATEDIHRGQQLILDASDTVTSVPASRSVPSLSSADSASGEVVNRTAAGEALQSVASDMLGLLPSAGHDVGWMDGGCRILAKALQGWSNGVVRLAVTGSETGRASHVAGALPLGSEPGAMAVMLDADGVSSPADVLHKLAVVERSPGEKVLAIGVKADQMSSEMLTDDALSGRLRQMIEMRLGRFDSWREGLCGELVECGYPVSIDELSPDMGQSKTVLRSQPTAPGI